MSHRPERDCNPRRERQSHRRCLFNLGDYFRGRDAAVDWAWEAPAAAAQLGRGGSAAEGGGAAEGGSASDEGPAAGAGGAATKRGAAGEAKDFADFRVSRYAPGFYSASGERLAGGAESLAELLRRPAVQPLRWVRVILPGGASAEFLRGTAAAGGREDELPTWLADTMVGSARGQEREVYAQLYARYYGAGSAEASGACTEAALRRAQRLISERFRTVQVDGACEMSCRPDAALAPARLELGWCWAEA